jgi:hypothetical protein
MLLGNICLFLIVKQSVDFNFLGFGLCFLHQTHRVALIIWIGHVEMIPAGVHNLLLELDEAPYGPQTIVSLPVDLGGYRLFLGLSQRLHEG